MTNNINKVDELFSKTMINKICHRSDNHEHKTVYIIKFTDLLMARELFRLRFHDSCTVTCKKTNTVKTSGQKRTYIWQQGNKQKIVDNSGEWPALYDINVPTEHKNPLNYSPVRFIRGTKSRTLKECRLTYK